MTLSTVRVGFFLAVFSLLGSVRARGQVPDWWPYPQTQPLTFGSLRLDPAFGVFLPDGEWSFASSVTEFNLWDHSWHTFATHRELKRYRLPVSDEELRVIERDFAHDYAWNLDVEGWRIDVVISRGLPEGRSFTVAIPWIEIGSPRWDRLGEGFHNLFGLSSLERDVFPRGETFIYLKDRGNRTTIRGGQELAVSGIGDVSLGYGFPLRDRWGSHQRMALTLQAPTGKAGTLQGSGGWDAGLSWFALWQRPRERIRLAAGATWLDTHGSFLGAQRTSTLHLMGEVEHALWRSFSGLLGMRVDSSPLRNINHGYPGYPATYYRLGIIHDQERSWVAFEFMDALKPQTGIEADWAFRLTAGTRIGRRK